MTLTTPRSGKNIEGNLELKIKRWFGGRGGVAKIAMRPSKSETTPKIFVDRETAIIAVYIIQVYFAQSQRAWIWQEVGGVSSGFGPAP